MTAASILAATEAEAGALGHSLGAWEHGLSFSRAACRSCKAEAVVRWRLGTEEVRRTLGGALTAHCKVPETAGRAA